MPTLNTTWLKRKINNVLTKTFAISHVKSTYYDYTEGTTLDDVLIETEDFDQSAVTEPDISPAILSKINEVSEQESSNFTMLNENKAEQTEVDSLKSDVVTNYATKSDVSTTYATKTELNTVKKSVSDGKSEVAGSITTMGVATAADATFHTMATNILAIESGIGELPLPITTFTATVQNTVVDLSWTLPTDSLRSGVEIWYKKTNDFGDEPSGTKAYDSNTMLGTTATSCSYDFSESETDFYATIYSYAYINNQRCYTKGKTIQFHTKQVKGFTKILTSGTFTVPAGVTSVDVCLVGGGRNGYDGYYYNSGGGGKGGEGGKINEIYNITVSPNSSHTITIGSGNNGATLFDSYTSADGTSRASGGTQAEPTFSNGITTTPGHNGYKGGDGRYAFDDSSLDGIRYGAGGGGGGGTENNSTSFPTPGAGGTNGGGTGGTYGHNGNPATENTGSGGGGGGSQYYFDSFTSGKRGGSGGSGICIIRWGY